VKAGAVEGIGRSGNSPAVLAPPVAQNLHESGNREKK